MSQSQVKELRKQIRNVVQELLPEILTAELFQQLAKTNQEVLSRIKRDIEKTLSDIDGRQKDVQSFIMRESLKNINTDEVKPVQPKL